MTPPNTLRYCKACERNRVFVYDRAIGHSRCKECGAGFAAAYNWKQELLSHLHRRLKEHKDDEKMCEELRHIAQFVCEMRVEK